MPNFARSPCGWPRRLLQSVQSEPNALMDSFQHIFITTGEHALELKLEQSQKPILVQSLRQSLQILQMGAAELEEYLAKQALENPFVRYEGDAHRFSSYSRASSATEADADAYQNMLSVRHREKTLFEALSEQLAGLRLPSRERAHVRFLIENVDARGYLSLGTAQIAELLQIPKEAAKRALNILMAFEPAGVGARSLRECLYLQLKRMQPRQPLCEQLVRDHLKDVAEQRYGMLSETYGVDRDVILDAVALIRSLNPKPGNGFANAEDIPYAPPDLIVEEDDGGALTVRLNPALAFPYRVDADYARQLRAQATSAEDRAYLTEQLNKAYGIGRGIQWRGQTLLKCGQAILARQSAFFASGNRALQPLTMREVADALSFNPSTITRAVKDKTLRCKWGAYPLGMFFVRPAATNGDAALSAAAVKARIADLIRAEDPQSPLSDRAIAELLNAEGVSASRRVVAKYREEQFIPSSFARNREKGG